MKKEIGIIKQEEKFIKRIGWATFYNEQKLQALKNWKEYFNLEKFTPEQRFLALSKIPGIIERQLIFENITPAIGFTQLTKAMTGAISDVAEIKVNFHALGTGTNAPSSSDIQLQTESYRKLLPSQAYSANKAYYTAFYTAAEVSGTFEEIGLFINGSATANSGSMWDRSLLHIVKLNTQTLTLDYEDTFING